MRYGLLLVVVAACGRFDFDARLDGTVADAPVATDVIAHYTMDSLAGMTLVDTSGHQLDATCSSCPSPDVGVLAGSLRFDGATTLLSVSSPLFDQASEYTVAFWVRRDQLPAAAACMVGKRYGAGIGNSWQICFNDGAQLFYSNWDGTTNIDTNPGTTLDAQWHHLAITFASPMEALFLDGTKISSVPRAKPFDSGSVVIGADIDNGSPLAYFSGWLDDVWVYNRALSDAEVFALAH